MDWIIKQADPKNGEFWFQGRQGVAGVGFLSWGCREDAKRYATKRGAMLDLTMIRSVRHPSTAKNYTVETTR